MAKAKTEKPNKPLGWPMDGSPIVAYATDANGERREVDGWWLPYTAEMLRRHEARLSDEKLNELLAAA